MRGSNRRGRKPGSGSCTSDRCWRTRDGAPLGRVRLDAAGPGWSLTKVSDASISVLRGKALGVRQVDRAAIAIELKRALVAAAQRPRTSLRSPSTNAVTSTSSRPPSSARTSNAASGRAAETTRAPSGPGLRCRRTRAECGFWSTSSTLGPTRSKRAICSRPMVPRSMPSAGVPETGGERREIEEVLPQTSRRDLEQQPSLGRVPVQRKEAVPLLESAGGLGDRLLGGERRGEPQRGCAAEAQRVAYTAG